MERFDFASLTSVIRADLLDGSFENQQDFVEQMFSPYLNDMEAYFDMGLVSKWLNGLAKPSPAIARYYMEGKNRRELTNTLEDVILPCLSDSAMVVQNAYGLLIGDSSISESKKEELSKGYPCSSTKQEAAFLTELLLFALSRPFVARDIRKPKLLSSGSLSPVVLDYVIDEGVPKPCRHFMGRDKELAELHQALTEHSKVFLRGIPGIGKSEIAKAYAKAHKKEYTNVLFLSYTGDLKADIANLIFADDLPQDNEEQRFKKHNRFLRTLKDDTLLIIDNFNRAATEDSLLDVVLKYRCRVLITTRSSFPNQVCLTVEEIRDDECLFRLVSCFYSKAEKNRGIVMEIIETIHRHTFAVELAARLLETGILKPHTVLQKLQEQRVSLDASDQINVTKDGASSRGTYYEHIHTLFGLFRLKAESQEILTALSLVPLDGITARLLGKWMKLRNLNRVNELNELGFVQAKYGNHVFLHPMTREVILADLPPSIRNCKPLLEGIRYDCQLHGTEFPYYKLMHRVILNTVQLAKKDDASFYLLFLEDTFQSFEKYQDEVCMRLLIDEMSLLLQDPLLGEAKDRAILLEYRSVCEKQPIIAIQLLQEALNLIPEVNGGNALAVSNLHANIGDLYRGLHQNELAKKHLETALTILEDYGLFGMHDSLTQVVSYANYLDAVGEKDAAVTALKKVEPFVRRENPNSLDHADLLQSLGCFLLPQKETVAEGRSYLMQAMSIYETVWADEPQLIEEKRRQYEQAHINAGIEIGKEIIKKRYGKT